MRGAEAVRLVTVDDEPGPLTPMPDGPLSAPSPELAADGQSGAPSGAMAHCVRQAMRAYLTQMGGHEVSGLYRFVLDEVERPLLETVLEYTNGNQTQAAQMLGLSRSTLRKKLKGGGEG